MPLCFCMLHSTRFWFKRHGLAVLNIDIISYLAVKNVILRFRPCWVYPVGQLICFHGSVSVVIVSSGPRVSPTFWLEEMKRMWGPKMTK